MTTTATTNKPIYICLARNFWGKGASVDEAKKNCKAAGGKLDRYFIYLLPTGATEGWVDNMGTIRWEWAEGADTNQVGTVVAKRGVNL